MKPKQTKPAFLVIIVALMIQNLHSQNYLITFSGSGQSNAVETVEVKNIAQQTTLTLSGTDTLLLTDVVGTGYLPVMKQGIVIYPNPVANASRLEFYNSKAGIKNIGIYDFRGRLLINNSYQLSAGSHAFTIKGLKAGIYLVKVNSPDHTYSQRLVSTSTLQTAPELHHIGLTQGGRQESDLKSINNIVAMQYNDGERLVFKAISGDYAHTKSLIPTESQNIDFEFIECLDGDGNHYGVVTIGEQVWMAENLKTTHYRNGTPIEYPGTNNSAWENNTTGAYSWYNNDISWKDSYGALYNWHAVNNTKGICPTGWHVPSDAEWTQLIDYVVAQGFPNDDLFNPLGAGNALKSCQQVHSPLGGDCNTTEHPRWESHSTHHGFDEFGFSAFPGGHRYANGSISIGLYGYWWSSTEASSAHAWSRSVIYGLGNVHHIYDFKSYGLSVRCIKD